MAIYSAVPPPPGLGGNASDAAQHQPQPQHLEAVPSAPTDIESWTLSALESLSISAVAPGIGIGHPLAIPLDEPQVAAKPTVVINDARSKGVTPPRRPPSRRDSQRRREALLKGKEGSRARRRWDNARLADVPFVEPPQPRDWHPHPTHPVHHVPYQLAAAWDLRVRADVEARGSAAARRKQAQTRTLGDGHVAGRVPRELLLRTKKTPAVRAWVRRLEEPVRRFLVEREVAKEAAAAAGDGDGGRGDAEGESESDSEASTEDDEIVFVGRNGATMRDGWKRARREREREGRREDEHGMVFDAVDDGEHGSFKRWLTHSISDYYGLDSRSVLVGNPTRKVVYVGIGHMKTGPGHVVRPPVEELPRPLWELCRAG